METKDRILEAALELFADRGYEAVSVGQIASAVGIKAPSLYKHYKSKQEIFEAVLEKMQQRYEKQAAKLRMDGADPGKDARIFGQVDRETLVQMVVGLFQFFLHDPWTARFRRMLTVEQYHNPELAELFSRQYYDEPLTYQGQIFRLLMGLGVMKVASPDFLALQFYGPIYLLLTVCDRQPEREGEILQKLERHVRQFGEIYGCNQGEGK